jgi:hypothetical protein
MSHDAQHDDDDPRFGDIQPEPLRFSGCAVVAAWILAALFFGSIMAIGLPN